MSIQGHRDFLLVKEKTPTYVPAFLIGVIAGLRSLTAPAVVKLGGSPRAAQTGKYLAGFSRICSHALHFDRSCDR